MTDRPAPERPVAPEQPAPGREAELASWATPPGSAPLGPEAVAALTLPGAKNARRNRKRVLRIFGAGVLVLALLLILVATGFDVGPIALATGLLAAVLPVPLYVWLALRVDRFEPEPLAMLAWAFFWGASGAAFIAVVLNTTGQALVGSNFGSDIGELYGASISAPVVEECAKAAILFGIYRWRRYEFDGVLDGIVYAAMVGLGFAMTENVLYYGNAAAEGGVPLAATFILRGVMAPFVHPVFTAMTGIGLGIAATTTKRSVRILAPAGGLLAAMFLHSLWNTSAGVEGGGAFLGVYALIMVPLFAGLILVISMQLRREGRAVGRWLQPEVASGILTADDVLTLASLRERSRAVRAARKAGGRDVARRRRAFDSVATAVAFRRDRAARGLPLDVDDPAAADAAGVAALREMKATLPAGPVPRASASLVALPPPGWHADPWRLASWRWWDGRQWTHHTG